MEGKKGIRISLSTLLLFIAIIAIVIMGITIYELKSDKLMEVQKSTELQSQVESLNETVSNLQTKIDSISDDISLSSSSTDTGKDNKTSSTESKSESTSVTEKGYNDYIGTWYNSNTQNEITIKKVTNNTITFTWFLYRLTGIDDDTTLSFSNGEAIFYFEGYDDKNYDSKYTEDEKYIRKATIKLVENGINVNVEDVKTIDRNYTVLNDPSFVYITEGLYSHPTKR